MDDLVSSGGCRELLPPGLSPEEVKLLDSWADPLDERTDKELMVELGIPVERLRALRNDRAVVRYLTHALEAGIHASRSRVVKALMGNAIQRGDTQAQKMLLEIMGAYKEQHEVYTTSRSVFVSLTDEELISKVREYADEIARFGEEEKRGKEIFGPTGHLRRSYSTGPVRVARGSRARGAKKEGVD